MAQRGLRPNGGPPFTLSDLAPWARGQIIAARYDDILRATAKRDIERPPVRLRANYRARRAILSVPPEGTSVGIPRATANFHAGGPFDLTFRAREPGANLATRQGLQESEPIPGQC
jgi:hypothetical protein